MAPVFRAAGSAGGRWLPRKEVDALAAPERCHFVAKRALLACGRKITRISNEKRPSIHPCGFAFAVPRVAHS